MDSTAAAGDINHLLKCALKSCNACRQVRIFAHVKVDARFEPGGRVESSYSIDTLSLEPLATQTNRVHFAFEVAVWVLVILGLLAEIGDFITTAGILRGHFRPMLYFNNPWNLFDMAPRRGLPVLI